MGTLTLEREHVLQLIGRLFDLRCADPARGFKCANPDLIGFAFPVRGALLQLLREAPQSCALCLLQGGRHLLHKELVGGLKHRDRVISAEQDVMTLGDQPLQCKEAVVIRITSVRTGAAHKMRAVDAAWS